LASTGVQRRLYRDTPMTRRFMGVNTFFKILWMRARDTASVLASMASHLLRLLIGDITWNAPAWLHGVAAGIRSLFRLAKADPRRAGLVVLGVLLISAGGYGGWRWYQAQPKPVTVDVQVTAPARTCYECEPRKPPNPATLTFSTSVAPLDAIGKSVDIAKADLVMTPATVGEWTWVDDHTLRFQPKADWPIGQSYRIRIPRSGLVAPQIHLSAYDLEFASAAFEAKIETNEFYQDPVQATEKKTVTTLAFSHPVDPASLEERIALTVYDRITKTEERKLEPGPPFTVTYDKLKLHAYVHSGQLPVPDKGGRATVAVEAGVHASRGGNRTSAKLTAQTIIPGLNSLTVVRASLQIVRDERNEPSQALLIETSHSVTEKEIAGRVSAWVLPDKHPDAKLQSDWERNNRHLPYGWFAASQITSAVLATSNRLDLAYVPNERDHVELHSFRVRVAPGQKIYVLVDKGLQSFGGYRMPDPFNTIATVPPYPQELQIAQQGSLLALSGKRKLTVFSRDVPALRIQVARLLPNQLQHLVSQSTGSLSTPEWVSGTFTASNVTETFTSIVKLPKLAAGEPHYEGIDLGEYLSRPGASRLGVFLLNVQAWDSDKNQLISGPDEDSCDECGYLARKRDTRLVLLTDLGLLVKKSQDGGQDVFVQSIHTGEPVAGALIEVMGRNGETVLHETSDAAGHAHFPDLKSFKQEKKPLLYVARHTNDLTFLPIDDRAHLLDLSRFDVGGAGNVADRSALTAYLFSDRGIYRPGEEIRAAAIVKSQDWRKLPAGLPLLVEITDPRGVTVRRETIKLSEAGFEELRYQTRDTSPAGSYSITVSIIRDDMRHNLIGSLTVAVRDFLPDRLRMVTHFSAEARDGWVSPENLRTEVALENLFGTPATGRRVTAAVRLSPSFPSFVQYKDYQFRDPQAAKEGFSETLTPQSTDDKGRASFALDLRRFARATYRVAVTVQGFEADGGRGVTNEAVQLVSSLPYLIGWKPDGDLDFIARGSSRAVRLLAVDPKLRPTEVKDLTLERIERRYVSMLLKQDNGTYRYESRLKEVTLASRALAVPAGGAELGLEAATPGKFSYVVHDASGQVYARIDYAVAGAANLTRSLEKNAELQITLNKKDYASDEEIEMQIQAPYTGAGLITIERERVYSWRWFKTSTTSSIQKIRVPAGVEGNAYVQVTFVRDPSSEEIYTSPLSYGIQPFSIALNARRNPVTLEAAELVKPGEVLAISYRTEKPSRIAVFAVDEGILQVAAYKAPDPLGHFFQKRAHAVGTRQILDLILPEFRETMLSAPGGDEGGAIGRHLNPFKRKTDPPVAWWSGIVEADSKSRELRYLVPETFNGRLRVMAVAVGPDTIGTAERLATVRGDFVLSPNTPLTVVPGDEFDVSVGVANNVKGSGAEAKVEVQVQPSAGLEVVGAHSAIVPIAELREASARFHVRARDELGSSSLTFTSALPGHSAKATPTLSIRPATPYSTVLHAGTVQGSVDVPTTRTLYPQYRTLRASISPLPLTLAHGLASYLDHYPYSCTEQIVSQALPALVLAERPEFRYLRKPAKDPLAGLVDELRLRQTTDGAYRYWPGGVEVVDFVSVYAQQLLLEAADRGHIVPKDLIDSGNRYLRTIARRDGNDLGDERTAAFAIYLLARQGVVVSNEIAALQKRLQLRYSDSWGTDITAGYVAASYELMKQHDLAYKALAPLFKGVKPGADRWAGSMITDADLLYLVARHFPDRLPRLPESLLPDLARRVERGEYQSLSAASTILALDAYARVAGARASGALAIAAILKDKTIQPLPLPDGLFPRVEFPATSTAIRLLNDGGLPGYYSLEESGFDRKPPALAETQGLEVIREYLSPSGQPVTSVKVGEDLAVRVRFRAIGRPSISDVVLVDLLPGGFDLAMPPPPNGAGARAAASPTTRNETADGEGEAEGAEEGDMSGPNRMPISERCGCAFLWLRPSEFPDYADLREDRVVLYGRATSAVQEFTYHIKATNAGTFVSPPAYGESMYEPGVRARSTAARLTVTPP
jgi:alpha-2-macroglobulin